MDKNSILDRIESWTKLIIGQKPKNWTKIENWSKLIIGQKLKIGQN